MKKGCQSAADSQSMDNRQQSVPWALDSAAGGIENRDRVSSADKNANKLQINDQEQNKEYNQQHRRKGV
jgi:hypothetical protein